MIVIVIHWLLGIIIKSFLLSVANKITYVSLASANLNDSSFCDIAAMAICASGYCANRMSYGGLNSLDLSPLGDPGSVYPCTLRGSVNAPWWSVRSPRGFVGDPAPFPYTGLWLPVHPPCSRSRQNKSHGNDLSSCRRPASTDQWGRIWKISAGSGFRWCVH